MTDVKALVDNTTLDSNTTEEIVNTVISSTFTKFGKYRVELSLTGEKKEVHWMTEKQFNQLMQCLSRTPKGFSCKDVYVTAVFDEKKYYKFARLHYAPRIKKNRG